MRETLGNVAMASTCPIWAGKARRTPLKDRRILVVEDDQFIAEELADLLAQEGADVFGPAIAVAEGAQLADYWPIEIAVMDLNLDGQSADDLVVELARKDVTVVVVSGYDIKQSVADNAFATIKKPVTSADLPLYRAANSAHHGPIATAPTGADTRLPRTR
jgi:ActR/RegA family two-component response regulator